MLTVDVHHHILPDFFWRETNEQYDPVGGIAPPPWSKEGALSFMDDAGVDVAVTSLWTTSMWTMRSARPRSARSSNPTAASASTRSERRGRALGTVVAAFAPRHPSQTRGCT
jgi:6-methylsalicylate decarboxylase